MKKIYNSIDIGSDTIKFVVGEYYKDKDFKGMEKEYEKIKEKLKELMPLEETLKQARQIENIHKIIKNNIHFYCIILLWKKRLY